MMDRDEARALTRKILSFASVLELEVELLAGRRAHLRFARNAASTSGPSEETAIGVTAWKGKRKASVSATLSVAPGSGWEDALRKLVSEAEALAALSPEDPEYMPLLGTQKYLDVNAWDRSTAELSPAERAKSVGDAIAYARGRNLVAAGIFRNSGLVQALANSAGLFAYFPSTSVSFSITARTGDGAGSGYAAISSVGMKSIDCKEAAAIAVKKALDSRGARELAPGAYTTILEPQAVADLSPSLIFALNARPADEGRSVFAAPGGKTRIGERLFDPLVTITTDPQHPVVPAASFSAGGYPTAKAYLARNGVLENLTNSRYWAKQKGRQPGPFFVNLVMEGKGESVAEMIASTERGILLTRLWYVRPVDPQQGLVTGLTRDGSFYIENGKIAHAIKNFRFNESLVRILGEVEALGTPQRVFSSEGINYGDGSTPLMLPALKVKSFHFTSLSDAV
jgi:predicted Zn-dependent protease